jgi:hypothetical protein
MAQSKRPADAAAPRGDVVQPAAEPGAALDILSAQEQQELATHEHIIEQGLETFVTVGNALLAIRDQRLYRGQFARFEDYCRDRWNMSRPRAYQLIDAATVVANVSTVVDSAPENEAQARPLAALPPAEQPAAWQEARQEAAAAGRPVTAAHVQKAVERRQPEKKPTAAAPAQAAPASAPVVLTPLAPAAPPSPPPGLDPGVLQAAVQVALFSTASSQAAREWERRRRELMERGQFPELIIRSEQLALAAQQLLDSPAVKAAAGLLAMGASLRLETLDGNEIESAAEEEEVIA